LHAAFLQTNGQISDVPKHRRHLSEKEACATYRHWRHEKAAAQGAAKRFKKITA
jgi:hypothetical protein